jgi:hypothetical protein
MEFPQSNLSPPPTSYHQPALNSPPPDTKHAKPRWPKGFFLYQVEQRKTLELPAKSLDSAGVSLLLADRWNALSPSERQEYCDEAAKLRKNPVLLDFLYQIKLPKKPKNRRLQKPNVDSERRAKMVELCSKGCAGEELSRRMENFDTSRPAQITFQVPLTEASFPNFQQPLREASDPATDQLGDTASCVENSLSIPHFVLGPSTMALEDSPLVCYPPTYGWIVSDTSTAKSLWRRDDSCSDPRLF